MRMRRVWTAVCAAAALAVCLASGAEADSAGAASQAETSLPESGETSLGEADASPETGLPEETGEASADSLPAAGSTAAGVRPSYRASDYVRIDDNAYRQMTIEIDPPSGSSEQAQADYRKALDSAIMTRLSSLYEVRSIPEDLENYVIGSLTSTYRGYAEMYGMDFGTFLSTYLGMDEAAFAAQAKTAADRTLKQELLLSAVAEKENITVSEQDFRKGLSDYAEKYGYDSGDALLADFDEATVRVSLLMDRTLDFLESVSDIRTETETESEGGTEADNPPDTLPAGPPQTAGSQGEAPGADPSQTSENPAGGTVQGGED